jgi:hypothetical protein
MEGTIRLCLRYYSGIRMQRLRQATDNFCKATVKNLLEQKRSSAREDFIEFCSRESFKTYTYHKNLQGRIRTNN